MGALEDEVRYAATTVWGNGSVVLALDDTEVGIADAAAVLNVDSGVRPDLRWTAVNSNGWVARVTSGNRPLPSDVNQANPVAALMAASLGVTEVFKRIYGVPPDVAPLLDLTEFSLYELTTSPKGIGPRRLRSLDDRAICDVNVKRPTGWRTDRVRGSRVNFTERFQRWRGVPSASV